MNSVDGDTGLPGRVCGAVAAWAPALLRWLLGSFFIASGWHKIADPHGFALAIYRYDLLPGILINPVAILLPWLEVVCGAVLILFRPWRNGALCWMLAMLVPFTAAILVAIARGFDIPCGCAGYFGQDTPVGWHKIGENALLIAAALALLLRQTRDPRAHLSRNRQRYGCRSGKVTQASCL